MSVAREYALETRGLSKAYRIYAGPFRRIAEAMTFGRLRGHHEFWALKDVDMKLLPGGSIGLCGANGAGSIARGPASGAPGPVPGADGRYTGWSGGASPLQGAGDGRP